MSRVVLLLGVVLLVGCSKLAQPSGKTVPEPAKTEPEPEPPPPPAPKKDPVVPPPKPTGPKGPNLGLVDGPKLQLDYATNVAVANSLYKDKVMTLPVVVYAVGRASNGELFVTMSTFAKPTTGEPDEPNYYFYFPKGQEGGAEMLTKGANCMIEGVCALYVPDTNARGGLIEYKWYLRFHECRLVTGKK